MTVEVLLALNLAVMLGYVAYQVSATLASRRERDRQDFEEIAEILGLSPVDLRLVTQISPVHVIPERSEPPGEAERNSLHLHEAHSSKSLGKQAAPVQELAGITPIFGRMRQSQERRSRLAHPSSSWKHRLNSQVGSQDAGA